MGNIAHSSRFTRHLAALSFAPLLFIGGCNTEFNFAYDKDGLNKPPVVKRVPLNDTGITLCGDYAYGGSNKHHNKVDCGLAGAMQTTDGIDADGDPVPAGQDAVYGRDAASNLSKVGYGPAGFDYTKLGADGEPLAIQDKPWGRDKDDNDNGAEANGTKWSCVRDNVTGLVWEVKTTSGLHDANNTYTWYDTNAANNNGNAGTADNGTNTTCQPTGRCDTEKFAEDVNKEKLCGFTDWRMPSNEELVQLVNHGRYNPAINTELFPHTRSSNYWSSSPYASFSSNAWGVYFGYGSESGYLKDLSRYVRLVRAEK